MRRRVAGSQPLGPKTVAEMIFEMTAAGQLVRFPLQAEFRVPGSGLGFCIDRDPVGEGQTSPYPPGGWEEAAFKQLSVWATICSQ